MSADTARTELEHAIQEVLENDHTVGVSPTEHDLATVELYELADEVRQAHQANVEIVWRDDGNLSFEPWGAR
jgi:hypothetical protein